ncbi:hypothetical protein CSC2_19950 [Clostridium zeae]|uniref:Uncharacterized protein n=1 Tax=Clostridium zeae TaxID=2759022 RepID=A0ABQ1E9W6_9CLOT|nr:hypothetical protein CSC2_19950 [Clostridium zeae]
MVTYFKVIKLNRFVKVQKQLRLLKGNLSCFFHKGKYKNLWYLKRKLGIY